MPPKSSTQPDFLPKLVRAALGKNARDCVGDMLEVVIQAMQSSGAVLWQATEGAKPKADPPQGCLFMLATAFPGLGSFGIHNLDFENTIAGQAVRQVTSKIVNDIRKNGGKHKDHPFLVQHGLNKTIALPFNYKGGNPGAVTIYRKADAPDFTDSDTSLLKRIFKEVPELLAAAQKRARQELLEKTGEIFKELEEPSSAAPDIRWKKALKKLCDQIDNLFHTAETSIILEQKDEGKKFFAQASKAGTAHRKRIRREYGVGKEPENSFTDACLTLKRSVRIFDLRQPEAEIAEIRSKGLPKFHWRPNPTLEADAREALGPSYFGDPAPDLPPLSFLAVPVMVGQRLHGAIRCWIATPPISYFSSQDEQLLEFVADQLGRQCELRRREEGFAAELTSWRKISDVFHSKRKYSSQFTRPMGCRETIDEFSVGCLNLLEEVVKGADLNALWLLGAQDNTLQCVSAPWIHDSPDADGNAITQWTSYVNQRLILQADSPVARALRDGDEQILGPKELSEMEFTLPGVRHQVLVPLFANEKKLGVLEMGSSKAVPFQESKLHAARLIAAFLSHHLATRTAVSGQQAAERALLDTERMTNDAFRDIMHQMKGPLVESARRIRHIADLFAKGTPQRNDVEKAEALVKRSFSTARRVGIFGQLVRTGKLSAGRDFVNRRQILEIIHDAWESARLRAHPRMGLRFNHDFRGIEASIPASSTMDLELLMHAIHNVLDNAIKYSFAQQEVFLDGGTATGGGWFLRVWNTGIPLRPSEVRLAKQRGWRSAAATLTTGEGSGIGLWLVDKIMQALGGTFEIQPTLPNGRTMARLQFNPVLNLTNQV